MVTAPSKRTREPPASTRKSLRRKNAPCPQKGRRGSRRLRRRDGRPKRGHRQAAGLRRKLPPRGPARQFLRSRVRRTRQQLRRKVQGRGREAVRGRRRLPSVRRRRRPQPRRMLERRQSSQPSRLLGPLGPCRPQHRKSRVEPGEDLVWTKAHTHYHRASISRA